MAVTATPLAGLPEVRPGDDLGGLLARAATAGLALRDGDVLAVAHKVVSKAEGRVRGLAEVEAGSQARELAAAHDKDPRAVQVVLDETAELLRAERGVLICRTRHGFVCANAGVDASNAGGEARLVLLPEDPDGSARTLRARLRDLTGIAPGVVITDSFGRAWRQGTAGVALGAAGVKAVVAESFARIFFRNCVATGELYPCETPARLVDAFRTNDQAVLDLEASTLTRVDTGVAHRLRPLGDAGPVIAAGGLFAYARQRGMIAAPPAEGGGDAGPGAGPDD